MSKNMSIWKEVEKRKEVEKKLSKMVERWDIAMECIQEDAKREIRKVLGEETVEDRRHTMRLRQRKGCRIQSVR